MSAARQPQGITVIGHGAAAASVDRVTVALAVEVLRAEPGDAWTVASGTATRLLAVLADDGVDARSVRTSDLTLGPRMEFTGNRQQLVGYQAGQRLTVIRDGLQGIERMLTDVATLGGEGVRIDGVSLTPGHPQDALVRARAAAFADAAAKAEQLAALAGRPLGRVRWIDELPSGGGPRPMMAMRAAADESMPVATGDAEVSVELTVHREFAD
ncbi:MAG TPA: SIMPL domain-containing protein [Nakamurella sp.]